MGEGLGEGTVVGQQDETFAVVVEAANGVEAQARIGAHLRGPFDDGGAAFGIVRGAEDAAGFVGEIGAVRFGLHGAAVELHLLLIRIHARPELGDDGAIDAHAAGGDEFLAMAAGADAGGGEEFLEADAG